jgi:hypothetical protein
MENKLINKSFESSNYFAPIMPENPKSSHYSIPNSNPFFQNASSNIRINSAYCSTLSRVMAKKNAPARFWPPAGL